MQDHFRPDPILLKAPRHRPLEGGMHELERPDGTFETVHPFCVAIVDGLVAGDTLNTLLSRAAIAAPELTRPQSDALARQFLWKLARQGFVRIDLEEPPDRFQERYRRVRELGRGGTGIAWLCEDETSGAPVVVKHAWGWLEPIEKTEPTVRREGEALRALAGHPVIPAWLAEFDERGLRHVVREHAEGPSLSRARELDALAVARQVASALAHVHARGWLALDVTPSNFVLRADGVPALIDVGLAHAWTGEPVMLRAPTGSRGYVAPEVLRDLVATPASDVWALGRLMFFLATRRAPDQAWDAAQLAAQTPGGPLREAIVACCADEPAARPPLSRLPGFG